MKHVGVVIGRFQVATLHEGHIALLSAVLERCSRLVVLVGVSPAPLNAHDPLPFFCRRDAISTLFPQATVLPVYDCQTDEEWSKQVDTKLKDVEVQDAVIYGGRDSSVRHYGGRWPIEELPVSSALSGSDIRKATDLGYSLDFRIGMIYAAQKRFATSYQTVDVACYAPDGQILLGQKPNEVGWRFPGGFVEPDDPSLAFAAVRELREECGQIETGGVPEMKYLDSVRIVDWRYRGSVDGIMTAFFAAPYKWGQIAPKDDLQAVAWWPREKLRDIIEPCHQPLVDILERANAGQPVLADG